MFNLVFLLRIKQIYKSVLNLCFLVINKLDLSLSEHQKKNKSYLLEIYSELVIVKLFIKKKFQKQIKFILSSKKLSPGIQYHKRSRYTNSHEFAAK